MIKKSQKYIAFEDNLKRSEKVDILKNFAAVDSLLLEAIALGAWPIFNPLEGLGVDIRIARVVNSVSRTS